MSNNMCNVKYLLLGGGYVLSSLSKKINPKEFIITTRSVDKLSQYKNLGYNSEILDITKEEEVISFFNKYQSIEVVIDSVPPVFDNRKPSKEDLKKSLVGVHNIFDSLKDYPLKRFVYLSTTGVYGETDGSIVTEETKTNPQSIKAKARLESENIYRKLNTEVSVFRLSAIYGPQRDSLESIKSGRYPYINNGDKWSNRIHVNDIVQVLLKSIDENIHMPGVLNLSDGSFVKTKEIIEYICSKYSVAIPKSISIKEALERGMHTLIGNKRVSNALLLKSLNITLIYPNYKIYYQK